ncbi:MAG: sugar transferase [Calditrichia bacterium]
MLDLLLTLPVFLALLPLLLILALLVKLQDGGSIFFVQKRVGRQGRPFGFYKFRTMVPNAHKMGPAVTQGKDPRITPVGRWLRKTKLDELPQLLNVIKGDISLVGPRPEVEKYVNIFKTDYREILQVKPGITDYATLEYRDEEKVLEAYPNPEEGYIQEVLPHKIELYKKYISEISLSTDLAILFKTLWRIIA